MSTSIEAVPASDRAQDVPPNIRRLPESMLRLYLLAQRVRIEFATANSHLVGGFAGQLVTPCGPVPPFPTGE